MPRVKRGTIHAKRRRNILRQTKGFFHRRKTHLREARQALTKAGQYAYAHRRKKKGDFRRLWNIQLSAALKPHEVSYSSFINLLKKQNITINRKMLVLLAQEKPAIFKRVVDEAKKSLVS
ncbi:MAG: 50S ribosomal protein L20 [bacterium]|nr:50S ribosomal protein L20 [bacterium]